MGCASSSRSSAQPVGGNPSQQEAPAHLQRCAPRGLAVHALASASQTTSPGAQLFNMCVQLSPGLSVQCAVGMCSEAAEGPHAAPTPTPAPVPATADASTTTNTNVTTTTTTTTTTVVQSDTVGSHQVGEAFTNVLHPSGDGKGRAGGVHMGATLHKMSQNSDSRFISSDRCCH